jgi:hypothetical protein
LNGQRADGSAFDTGNRSPQQASEASIEPAAGIAAFGNMSDAVNTGHLDRNTLTA